MFLSIANYLYIMITYRTITVSMQCCAMFNDNDQTRNLTSHFLESIIWNKKVSPREGLTILSIFLISLGFFIGLNINMVLLIVSFNIWGHPRPFTVKLTRCEFESHHKKAVHIECGRSVVLPRCFIKERLSVETIIAGELHIHRNMFLKIYLIQNVNQ